MEAMGYVDVRPGCRKATGCGGGIAMLEDLRTSGQHGLVRIPSGAFLLQL